MLMDRLKPMGCWIGVETPPGLERVACVPPSVYTKVLKPLPSKGFIFRALKL